MTILKTNKQSTTKAITAERTRVNAGLCLYLSKRSIMILTLTQSRNHTAAVRTTIESLLTHAPLWCPGTRAVERFRTVHVQTAPLTHTLWSRDSPEPAFTVRTFWVRITPLRYFMRDDIMSRVWCQSYWPHSGPRQTWDLCEGPSHSRPPYWCSLRTVWLENWCPDPHDAEHELHADQLLHSQSTITQIHNTTHML